MSAIIYQPNSKWRFGVALAGAAAIHLAAISVANVQRMEPPGASGPGIEPSDVVLEPVQPDADPASDLSESLPTPPAIDQTFIEVEATPPPVRRQTKFTSLVRPRDNGVARSSTLSAATVFAVRAPRPESPYEARRQKITGEGIARLTVDPGSGAVIQVTMAKSTGNTFLDNAAIVGFARWRFKPGTVSSVSCPVTFTLTGVSY